MSNSINAVKRKPVYCGACSMDISAAVRIRCAQLAHSAGSSFEDGGSTRKHEPFDVLLTRPRSDGMVPTCDEFDICGSCFCEGKEIGRHKRWHDYRVVVGCIPLLGRVSPCELRSIAVSRLSTRIPFSRMIGERTSAWTYNQRKARHFDISNCRELLLISACQTFGLGNWADIAEHIGSFRAKDEVEAHYLATYIESPDYPLPVSDWNTKAGDLNVEAEESLYKWHRSPMLDPLIKTPFKHKKNEGSRKHSFGPSVCIVIACYPPRS